MLQGGRTSGRADILSGREVYDGSTGASPSTWYLTSHTLRGTTTTFPVTGRGDLHDPLNPYCGQFGCQKSPPGMG